METSFGSVNFERRKHPRFSVELPVGYRKINNSETHPAQTGDLSEGGLLLYVSEPLEIGEILAIEFSYKAGHKLKVLQARVQVVWKDIRFSNEGFFRMGVKFLEISRDDFQSLKDFLLKLMKDKSVPNLSSF